MAVGDVASASEPLEHPKCARRVVFRSQFAGRDAKEIIKTLDRSIVEEPQVADPDDIKSFWRALPDMEYPEVEVDGETFYEVGRCKSKFSDVELPPLFLGTADCPDSIRLFDKDGKEKVEGDAPLGVAYDERGLPVPDWQVEDTRYDAEGREVFDENGRRRGYLEINGVVNVREVYGAQKNVWMRAFPKWGKRYGTVYKDTVGQVGTLNIAQAKLCLETEDFGWKLGDDEHARAAKTPPLVRLCYAEDHGECASIILHTGLSEIHLDNHEDHVATHAMLQSLGYVCYNIGTRAEYDRDWGEGVHRSPIPVHGEVRPDGTPLPTFYSWLYRLPPYLSNLAVEGEEGDPVDGPTGRKYVQRNKELDKEAAGLRKARLEALKARVANEQTKPWYKDLQATLGPCDAKPAAPLDDENE